MASETDSHALARVIVDELACCSARAARELVVEPFECTLGD
jgi:hypothetical protein